MYYNNNYSQITSQILNWCNIWESRWLTLCFNSLRLRQFVYSCSEDMGEPLSCLFNVYHGFMWTNTWLFFMMCLYMCEKKLREPNMLLCYRLGILLCWSSCFFCLCIKIYCTIQKSWGIKIFVLEVVHFLCIKFVKCDSKYLLFFK